MLLVAMRTPWTHSVVVVVTVVVVVLAILCVKRAPQAFKVGWTDDVTARQGHHGRSRPIFHAHRAIGRNEE
jgi:protein-S-isoprenylcysteine O-methyltransferase Ste14